MKIALPFVIVGLDPTIHNDKRLFTIESSLNTIHKPYGFWIPVHGEPVQGEPAFAGMTILDWIGYFRENLRLLVLLIY
jgi:hypothetical protein